MNLFNTWQFNLVGYLISIVIFFQFYKIAAKNSESDTVTTIVLQLVGGATALFFSLFSGFKFPSGVLIYFLLALSCLFYTINNILQTKAIRHLPISMYTILNQLSTVFLVVYGVIIFKEPLILNKILGALFIIAGNITALYRKNINIKKGFILFAVAASFTFSIALSIDVLISEGFNLANYLLITFTVPPIILMLLNKISAREIKSAITGKYMRYLIITGFVWFLIPFFGIRAIQLGTVTTVVPLQAVSVLLNILIAMLFQGEKDNLLRIVTAALLVILGVSLTVFI